MIYKCMILPVFDYGDVFFNFSVNKTLINKLQVLQNSAIRIICKLPKRTNTEQDELNLKLLPLTKRRLLHSIQLAATYTFNPENLGLNASGNIRTRAISKSRRQLKIMAPKKAICERSFCYQMRRNGTLSLQTSILQLTELLSQKSFTQILNYFRIPLTVFHTVLSAVLS